MTHESIIANTVRVESAVIGSRSIELRYCKRGSADLAERSHYLIIDGEWDGYTETSEQARKTYRETVDWWEANSYATEEAI